MYFSWDASSVNSVKEQFPFFFLLQHFKVFDVSKEAPDKVLHRIYLNLEKLKLDGDEYAAKIQEELRIIVSTA